MDLEKFGEITFLVENGKVRFRQFVDIRYFCEMRETRFEVRDECAVQRRSTFAVLERES